MEWESAASAATAAIVVAAAVIAAAAVVVTVVAAAREEKDKDDDPPAAVVVSEHEISPRKKNLYRFREFFVPTGMLYDMKTFSRWLQNKNRRNDWRIL